MDEEMKELEQEVENIEALSTEEFESYLSTDGLEDYIKIIKRYTPATLEDNIELHRQIKNGSRDARDLMIKQNMRLVLGVVMRSTTLLHSYTKLDLIQDGTLGLLTAIKKFDPEKGAFSTYACQRIKQAIQRGINTSDASIKRANNFILKRTQYSKMQYESESKGTTVSDEDAKEKLNISDKTLRLLKIDSQLDIKSLDEVFTEFTDEGDAAYIDVIGDRGLASQKVNDDLVDEELLAFLKTRLSPCEYYIIYHRVLSPANIPRKFLGAELGITNEAIRQKENRIKEKIKSFYDKDGNIESIYANKLRNIRTTPINPTDIALYLFVREALTEPERIVAKEMLTGIHRNYNSILSNVLSIDEGAVDELVLKTTRRISDILSTDGTLFTAFKRDLISKYKSKIYKIDLDKPLEFTDKPFFVKPVN